MTSTAGTKNLGVASSTQNQLLPIIVLFAIGASKVVATKRVSKKNLFVATVESLVVAVLVHSYLLPAPSIVPWWNISTRVLSRGVLRLLPNRPRLSRNELTFSSIVRNGPLGPGVSKVVQVLVATGLWRILKKEWPAIQVFGHSRKYPGLWEWSILVGIMVVVNGVLYTWSRVAKSTGNHEGVDRLVSPTKDRSRLTLREKLLYASLALINATCEELAFRWFWRSEFSVYLPDGGSSSDSTIYGRCFRLDANLAQAALFGTLHYHGIPSGFAGVGLTFVYGWIMGVLMEYVGDGGLFLPIVAHTIADYYLFSSVARGKAMCTNTRPTPTKP